MVVVVAILLLASYLGLSKGHDDPEDQVVNPHEAEWLTDEMNASLETLERIDDDGYMYEMDFDYDYYNNPVLLEIMKEYGIYDAGCSAFVTWNETGDSVLTARNYDYKHTTPEGEITGLNVAIHCAPEGKYRSIGIADAYWLDYEKGTFCSGVLDDETTDISLLVLLPYVCMDGINEKGVSVSILKLNIKEGEEPVYQKEEGKTTIGHSVLMRYILDSCASVEEAIALAEQYNITGAFGMNFHIFVTDATGASAVLEWRYGKMFVTDVNVVSNFYSGFDDAEDYYKDGVLVENVVRLESTVKEYRYGYGHGYHRLTGIVSALERYIDFTEDEYMTKMTKTQAMHILSVAAQDPGTEATSMTQYSVVYDTKNCSAVVCMHQDYDSVYTITLD